MAGSVSVFPEMRQSGLFEAKKSLTTTRPVNTFTTSPIYLYSSALVCFRAIKRSGTPCHNAIYSSGQQQAIKTGYPSSK
ncbi:hypothetical protein [Pantoea sp. KPR_PJ]|uniref:hypothetical protein n=1 Tax=Pantoea sp. KPR_PJ TaxID=2738375 RepID=UPI0035282F76